MKTNQSIVDALIAYAQLTRASNLPTVFSNGLVGSAVAAGQGPLPWRRAMIGAVALSALYAAGMATNDAVDARSDRLVCPGRPIPSGRISRGQAWVWSAFAIAGALWMLSWTTPLAVGTGLALAVASIGYNLTHKKHFASIALMGVCRGLVYLTAASAVATKSTTVPWVTVYGLAVLLATYTTLLTWVARTEDATRIDARRWLFVAMPLVALGAAVWLRPGTLAWAVGAAVAMIAWLGRGALFVFDDPPQTRRAVMVGLSGLCLVDTYFLTLMDRPGLAVVAMGCFAATAVAHRQVAGT